MVGPQSMLDRFGQLIKDSHGTHRGWLRLQFANVGYSLGQLEHWTQIRVPKVRRVVFVCLGNINRSAFAHAVADKIGLEAASFGLATTTGGSAYEKAISTAPRFGVSLEKHKATDISDFDHRDGDLLVVMEVRHIDRLLSRGHPDEAIALLGRWSAPMRLHIHDPHTLSDGYFLTCFSILNSAVRNLAIELAGLGHPAAGISAAHRPCIAQASRTDVLRD